MRTLLFFFIVQVIDLDGDGKKELLVNTHLGGAGEQDCKRSKFAFLAYSLALTRTHSHTLLYSLLHSLTRSHSLHGVHAMAIRWCCVRV